MATLEGATPHPVASPLRYVASCTEYRLAGGELVGLALVALGDGRGDMLALRLLVALGAVTQVRLYVLLMPAVVPGGHSARSPLPHPSSTEDAFPEPGLQASRAPGAQLRSHTVSPQQDSTLTNSGREPLPNDTEEQSDQRATSAGRPEQFPPPSTGG